MDANTIEDLTLHFVNKLSILNSAVILSNATADQRYVEVRDSLSQLLDNMKLVLRSMRRDVESARGELQCLEEMKRKCHDLLHHMQFVLTNIPLKLPIKTYSQDNLMPQVTVHDHGGVDHHLKGDVNQVARSLKGDVNQVARSLKGDVNQVTRSCNYLDFLTVDEFEAVPKYMKGRLTYDRVNIMIEHLDKVFLEKYKLLKQKAATLSELNRRRVEVFRLQENKETEGALFITEKDIADFSSLKVDSSVRNMVTILRHFNILHEIRGGGYARFAVASRF